MDGRLTRTNSDEAVDYVVPNMSSPRDLVSRPDSMAETVLSSYILIIFCLFVFLFISRVGFKSRIWLKIAPIPVHFFSFTFNMS